MRPRTTAAALAAGLTLITGGTATATTGAAGSGISGAVQYQPEQTGTVPVTPPETPPAEETAPPVVTSETSVSAPPVTTTTTQSSEPSAPPTTHRTTAAKPATPAQTPAAAAEQTPAATPVAESSASSLPFTGYDVVPVALLGLALLALGGGLVHRSRRSRG